MCLCVEVGGWACIFKKSLFIPFLIFGIKNEIIKAKLTEEYDLCRQKRNAPGSRLSWPWRLPTDNWLEQKETKKIPSMKVSKQPCIPTASLNSLAEILPSRATRASRPAYSGEALAVNQKHWGNRTCESVCSPGGWTNGFWPFEWLSIYHTSLSLSNKLLSGSVRRQRRLIQVGKLLFY